MIRWDRLFGLALTDFFTNSPFEVELEKDLSIRQQFLDVVIIRKAADDFEGLLPDGLSEMADHNLLSYKSMQEPLDAWAIDELVGHYVNYRKQVRGDTDSLLPIECFKLYGVSTQFPQKLAEEIPLASLRPGIYQVQWGVHLVSVLVLSQMPPAEHNAIWNLFSADQPKVTYGATQYRRHSTEMSSIINQVFERYQLEDLIMPYTMDDYRREIATEYFNQMTPEERKAYVSQLPPKERLEGIPVEERLEGIPVEERLEGIPVEERLEGIPVEQILQRLSIDEILQRLSVEELRAHLDKLGKQKTP